MFYVLLVSQWVAGDRGWAVLVDRVFMRRTPGGWVWCRGGRQDKRRTRTGTRVVFDNIVMSSGVLRKKPEKRRGPPERAPV